MDYAMKLMSNTSRAAAIIPHLPLTKQMNSMAEKTTRLAKTLIAAKTNISTYTEQYSLPSNEIGLITSVNGNDYSLSSIQSLRQEQTTTFPTQTVATYIINNKRPTIIIYPTVSPESIVIPIVSCIFGFPILALLVICCLRRRAKMARERDRRRNYDMQDHAVSLVRFSPIHRLNCRSSRPVSLRPERSLSRGFPSLELDTVMEERSDIEQTQTEIITADSPLDSTSFKASFSS